MSHSPKEVFDYSIERAKHMLALYDILHNSRQRSGRSDWLNKLKALMHWPQNEDIVRIDGKDKNSMLILREGLGVSSDKFAHAYVSELLRSAIVSSVSAMDRYFHDLLVSKAWKLLSQAEDDVPKKLKELPIPALAVRRALESLRADGTARPGYYLKKEIQAVLHDEYTFQSVSGIDNAVGLLGYKKFWDSVGGKLGLSAAEAQEEIRTIARRRNQIVHEADIVLKTKGKQISPRDISRADAEKMVGFIERFITEVGKLG